VIDPTDRARALPRSDTGPGGQPDHAILAAIFANVPNAIAVVDGAGRFHRVNPGFETLFDFTADEVEGRSLVDLIVPESGWGPHSSCSIAPLRARPRRPRPSDGAGRPPSAR
jgi:PAS domain S-box-containing protein